MVRMLLPLFRSVIDTTLKNAQNVLQALAIIAVLPETE
jgi:hypothetical protein